jgi:phosphate starvation-inducible PhoH-like protein
LPNVKRSGLIEAINVLKDVDGISFQYFDESDVVRHQLVQRIIRAYDAHKERMEQMPLALEPGVSARSQAAPGDLELENAANSVLD